MDPEKQVHLENAFARFSIWTSNIGVFANSHASLDHRLRGVPSIERLVVGLMEVIHGRIEQCMYILSSSLEGEGFFYLLNLICLFSLSAEFSSQKARD